jgi:hypothetical protein
MEDAILIFLVLILGIVVGWKVHEAIIVYAIKHDPESIEEALRIAKQELNSGDEEISIETSDGRTVNTKGVELAIEHVNGHLYAYAKSNNQFIAQGETLELLLESAHKRFPGKVFFGDVPNEEHQKS